MALCWHSDDRPQLWGWPSGTVRHHGLGDPSSTDYGFETDPIPDWPTDPDKAQKLAALLFDFIAQLELPRLTAEELRSALWRFFQSENRALRKAMESSHRRACERGRGFIVSKINGNYRPARCKSWRECNYCAWVYGKSVERLFKQVKRLRALVVFTMPRELGDPFNKAHLMAQARAMRRFSERLFRRFNRRFSMVWTREHNTKGDGPGRLHLNALWDEKWVDQRWLSDTARACGFGKVVDISRIGLHGRHALRSGSGKGSSAENYETKCLRYASKDLSSQTDWPKGTRRWGASRAARAQMLKPERNGNWFWSPVKPPSLPIAPAQFTYWILPDEFLPHREPSSPKPLSGDASQLRMNILHPRAPDPAVWH